MAKEINTEKYEKFFKEASDKAKMNCLLNGHRFVLRKNVCIKEDGYICVCCAKKVKSI